MEEEEKPQQYIQASPHFLRPYTKVLQLSRRSLGARLGIDMSSATTGEAEMFSGAEIHISARRRGSFYLKSRAEQAVKAELETLLHGSGTADSTPTGRGLPHPSKLPVQVSPAGTAHGEGVMSQPKIQHENNMETT